jgi:hypothetical protein
MRHVEPQKMHSAKMYTPNWSTLPALLLYAYCWETFRIDKPNKECSTHNALDIYKM